MLNRLLLSCFVFTVLWSVPLAAQAQGISRIDTALLGRILAEEGYAYTTDKDGDFIWKMEGYRTLLAVAKDKTSLTFRASFSSKGVGLSKINAWNQSKRFSKTYLDDSEDPILQLDLDLAGGVSRERIKDYLRTCRISLTTWISEVVN